jgi:hypothetical protein
MTEPQQLQLLKDLYPDADIIKGTDIFRGILGRKVTKAMLTDGQARIESCRIKGDGMDDAPQARIVIYDKVYALAKLINIHASLLDELSESEWLALMSNVYFKRKASSIKESILGKLNE